MWVKKLWNLCSLKKVNLILSRLSDKISPYEITKKQDYKINKM